MGHPQIVYTIPVWKMYITSAGSQKDTMSYRSHFTCRDIQSNYRYIFEQVKTKGCVVLFKHNLPEVVIMSLKEFDILYRETKNRRLNRTRLTIALSKHLPSIKKLIKNGHFIDG